MNTEFAIATILPAAGILLSLLFLILAFRNYSRKRLIDDVPTCKTSGVFIGLVELVGTAESDAPFSSPFTKSDAVYSSWTIEEEWKRLVQETYQDEKGRTQTRMREESGWTIIGQDTSAPPFYIKDDEGVLMVNPVGAKVEPVNSFSKVCTPADGIYSAYTTHSSIPNSTHRRRFEEWIIPLHSPLYVIGKAKERVDIVAPVIAFDKESPLFIVSTRPEKKISSGYMTSYIVLSILALLVLPGALFLRSHLKDLPLQVFINQGMIAVSAFVLLWTLSWIWTVFNSLVGLKNRVKQAQSNVDVQLKRRADLIPQLLDTMKSYLGHERGTLETVTLLRTQQMSDVSKIGEETLKSCTGSIKALAENYPALKSNSLFKKFNDDLIQTEKRIALARSYHNDTVTFFNTRLEIFPDNMVGFLAGLRKGTLISADGFEKENVKINLK